MGAVFTAPALHIMAKAKAEKKTKSKARKIVDVVLTVILVLIFVLCVAVLIHVHTADDPSIFGYSLYTVVTDSMSPTLHVGEVILVKRVEASEIHEGDIVTFHGTQGELDGKIVTHRVVSDGVVDGYLTTRGDKLGATTDDPIPFTDVIGKMIKKSGSFYVLYSVFTSKEGFLLLVFIPLFVMLIVQIVSFAKAVKSRKEDSEEQETQEESDRKLIEEYLKRQKKKEEEQAEKKDD